MRRPILCRKAIGGLVACVCFFFPQLASQAQTRSQRSEWFGAQNRWQQTAIDVTSQSDTVSPELRAKRNAYLQHSLEIARASREPEGLPPGTVAFSFGGSFPADVSETSAPQHAVWMIAKFESFHVFAADAQYRLIYTEINYRITRILRQPSSLSLSVGSELDSEWPGGRIKKPDGKIASFSVRPAAHSMRPGGTYLMAGTYDPSTGYFTVSNWWDLSSGRIVPGTMVEINRASNGSSKLNGLTTGQAVQYLDSVLPSSD